MPARKSLVHLGILAAALLLPFNGRADEREFAKTTRDIRQGIFLVGGPEVGTGTAWVISKKHRLLVTNAHVADMFSKAAPGKCKAMMNNSGQTYGVVKAWYHPGVKRYASKDENLSLRASNVKFGPVDPLCPDLAVLQLAPDGPDLPVELKIAGPKVLLDLQALPVAIMGFPGHDTYAWPGPGKKAQATFHVGVVSRVTDFNLEGGAQDELAQMLQYTMESWGGFSGSPVFLSSGEVVGAHNMTRTVDAKGTRKIAHGIRADSLWELLVHHKLTDRLPVPLAADKVLVKRWYEPDPMVDLWSKVSKLEREGASLIFDKQDFAAGIAKCDEAIKLYPRYAPAYRTRGGGYNSWYFTEGRNWSLEKKLQALDKSLADAEINIKLHRAPTLDSIQNRIFVYNNLGYVTNERKYKLMALEDALTILKMKDLTPYERASALSTKAVALSNLGNTDDARLTHNQAINTYPDEPAFWETRARFNDNNDNENQGRQDWAMAKALRKKFLLLNKTNWKEQKVVSEVKERLTKNDPADGQGRRRQSWTVELEAGNFYQIDLKNPVFKNAKDYDPILRLADDKGRLLAEDDDGGGWPHARIFFSPGRTAKYSLIVSSFEPGQTGPFVLTVTRIAKDE